MGKETKNFLLIGLIASIVLVPVLSAAVILKKQSIPKAIGPLKAASIVLNTVNTYFVPTKNAQLADKPVEESGLYKVALTVKNNTQSFYLTKDGELMIFPNGFTQISKLKDKPEGKSQNKQEEIPKAKKPVVELFVMSLCPYGMKAQKQISPVIDSFGDKINFKTKFIVNVKGNSIKEIASLHGIDEVKEDLRQAAIMKYYPEKFSAYIDKMNENSCVVSCGALKLEDSWKDTAKKLKIDIKKIENFAYGQEGIDLLKSNEADAEKYGADASPTLVINGVKSSAIYQDKNVIKSAICSAFLEPCDVCVNSK